MVLNASLHAVHARYFYAVLFGCSVTIVEVASKTSLVGQLIPEKQQVRHKEKLVKTCHAAAKIMRIDEFYPKLTTGLRFVKQNIKTVKQDAHIILYCGPNSQARVSDCFCSHQPAFPGSCLWHGTWLAESRLLFRTFSWWEHLPVLTGLLGGIMLHPIEPTSITRSHGTWLPGG